MVMVPYLVPWAGEEIVPAPPSQEVASANEAMPEPTDMATEMAPLHLANQVPGPAKPVPGPIKAVSGPVVVASGPPTPLDTGTADALLDGPQEGTVHQEPIRAVPAQEMEKRRVLRVPGMAVGVGLGVVGAAVEGRLGGQGPKPPPSPKGPVRPAVQVRKGPPQKGPVGEPSSEPPQGKPRWEPDGDFAWGWNAPL